MNITRIVIKAMLVSTSLLGISLASAASAQTLVECGPNGAQRYVEKAPAGCRVVR